MRKTTLILIIGFLAFGCASNKPKNSFALGLFANLETRKCEKHKIDAYLLQTSYFESMGSRNGVRTYQTFAKYKDIFTINTYDNKNYYYLATNNPDIYNFIRKNGTFLNTATDENDNGRTFLKYSLNSDSFYIGIEESQYGRIYKIQSLCD
ncbi:MAG: hypothetical protein KDC90_19725 [Ignavibacteriae bacterium]|nr:hypothetical protein [Ignavibacteriota bacterium]